jgi:hypothetical protein
VFRTEKRRSPPTGRPYPWIVRSTAMVNHYYIYAVDRDFGPFFLKFWCSVSAPTLFSAKFNGRNVDNQRKADRWG